MSEAKPRRGATRAAAAQALQQVLQQGRSLSSVLPSVQQKLSPADKGWVQAVCFEVLRELPRYEWLIQQLLEKPLKAKVRSIHYLLMVGLCQLRALRTPEHAALAETVEAALQLRQRALKGLVNGTLRTYLRQQDALEQQVLQQVSLPQCFPRWLRDRITNAWPEQAPDIFQQSQQKPPLWLRINSQHCSGSQYVALLEAAGISSECHAQLPFAVRLNTGTDITQLPRFHDGWVSVQDLSAQWASVYVQAQPGELVLDACAAPGGKTAALLEQTPNLRVHALDFDAGRLTRVHENLTRLQLNAEVMQGDAACPQDWFRGELYDRILLDAPCSATGVIRRHPDIRWLRRNEDIAALVALQARILDAQWSLLKEGGRLVYATCSILPDENHAQIHAFLARTPNARLMTNLPQITGGERQIFPGEDGGDGFYYAVLQKA
ncbi:16S rRNA (cytosine(967)-C(5))-methyltransferase RsmB [Aliidiomarina celeris]|uniref:16S rRNA (cytosine(967)-C(5))-methyltransferase RsmB n=1 Tax=Aliidiomarina celeris TaxID=2249428 RepID=UPI000DE96AFB|nr:16S rRNA (cytosine(967)-C(5))-methyltransferase RsmB [Aliidiomarina celeris]